MGCISVIGRVSSVDSARGMGGGHLRASRPDLILRLSASPTVTRARLFRGLRRGFARLVRHALLRIVPPAVA